MAYDEGIVVLDEHARARRAGHAAGVERCVALRGVNDNKASRLRRVNGVHLDDIKNRRRARWCGPRKAKGSAYMC